LILAEIKRASSSSSKRSLLRNLYFTYWHEKRRRKSASLRHRLLTEVVASGAGVLRAPKAQFSREEEEQVVVCAFVVSLTVYGSVEHKARMGGVSFVAEMGVSAA